MLSGLRKLFGGKGKREAELQALGASYGADIRRDLDAVFNSFEDAMLKYLGALQEELGKLATRPFSRGDTEDCLIELAHHYDEITPEARQNVLSVLAEHVEIARVLDSESHLIAEIDRRFAEQRLYLLTRAVNIQGEFCERMGVPLHR